MKKILLLLALTATIFVKAQAHIGVTFGDLKSYYPNKVFTYGYLSNGLMYVSTNFEHGTFYYYFNEVGTTYLCCQVPYTSLDVNAQAEIYNRKYTINSTNSWTAYLDNGGIMNIKLRYDNEMQTYVFTYF